MDRAVECGKKSRMPNGGPAISRPLDCEMQRRTTLQDIADRAGVDRSTVSRVLRGVGDLTTRRSTRDKIRRAAAELGYVPNRLAVALRTARSNQIGVVITNLNNPTYSDLVMSIQEAARARGLATTIYHVDEEHIPPKSLQEIASASQLDGLIIAPRLVIEGAMGPIEPLPCPFVFVSEAPEISGFVALDHAMGARMATEHLLRLGHRRICLLPGDKSRMAAQRRAEGYRAAIKAYGAIENIAFSARYDGAATTETIGKALHDHRRPTAFLLATEEMAIAALHCVVTAGFDVPRDASLIALQDSPLLEFTLPKMTCIGFPIADLGRIAANDLIAQINGEQSMLPMILKPRGVIERSSVGPAH